MGDWNFENAPECITVELEPFFEPESYEAASNNDWLSQKETRNEN